MAKSLEVKTTDMDFKGVDGEERKADYLDLVKTVVNSVPKDGFTPEAMRKRLRILDAIAKAKDILELEDDDIETLKACAKVARWVSLHKGILDFLDDVEAL